MPLAVPFSDLVFRSIHLRHFASANFVGVQPLFAAGGGIAGSRYVLPGGPAALYAAMDAETAYREGNKVYFQAAAAGPVLHQAGGIRPDPAVLIGIHIRALRLLDLRDHAVWGQLGILGVAELIGPWIGVPNAPTQVLGDTVFHNGHFEGMIFPSAQNPGHDAVILFPARLDPASRVTFIDRATGLVGQSP
jgi:hypothetical protein